MPYLLFLKNQQIFNCCLLQIIGGALWVLHEGRYFLIVQQIPDLSLKYKFLENSVDPVQLAFSVAGSSGYTMFHFAMQLW